MDCRREQVCLKELLDKMGLVNEIILLGGDTVSSLGWPSHWLLGEDHRVFRDLLSRIISPASDDLAREDARETLGDEDHQCSHFFAKAYSQLQAASGDLTEALLCCSKIGDPVLELRHYQSVRRRNSKRKRPQLVENVTGADFALTLEVDVPGDIRADRSVLGQAKLIDDGGIPIARMQLDSILQSGGPESATYLMWGCENRPVVVSAENVRSLSRVNGTNRLDMGILRFGKPFAEFLIEAFIGLWFGRDFDRSRTDTSVPHDSPAALYAMLHIGPPPPNVIHLGIGTSQSRDLPPGVYVTETVRLDNGDLDERPNER